MNNSCNYLVSFLHLWCFLEVSFFLSSFFILLFFCPSVFLCVCLFVYFCFCSCCFWHFWWFILESSLGFEPRTSEDWGKHSSPELWWLLNGASSNFAYLSLLHDQFPSCLVEASCTLGWSLFEGRLLQVKQTSKKLQPKILNYMWHHLWTFLQTNMFYIFQASLNVHWNMVRNISLFS